MLHRREENLLQRCRLNFLGTIREFSSSQHYAFPMNREMAKPMELQDSGEEDYLRLALVPGVGSRILQELLQYFGSAEVVLRATLTELGQVDRVGPKVATAIREAAKSDDVHRVLEHCKGKGIRVVLPWHNDFPKMLKEIPSPPTVLFCRGEFQPQDALSIGIVGTRHATLYGRQVAESLSRGLSLAGMTIVSGLARGIDGVAHRAALDSGGRTIAFLGSCVDDVYPPEHQELAQRIVENGLLASETPPFSKPKSGVFPQRNRLISGLSVGVIIVEAAERSGALITATHAGEQGRDIFAVPGPITSRVSRGCNKLIRDGAILVQDAQDVIEHLGPLMEGAAVKPDQKVLNPRELLLNDQEKLVLQAIQTIPTDLDVVVQTCQLPVARVLSTISVLEIRGLVARSGGRSVMRKA